MGTKPKCTYRNAYYLIQDPFVLSHKNERYANIGMRIQDARSRGLAKLNTLIVDENERRINIEHDQRFTSNTFLSDLQHQRSLSVKSVKFGRSTRIGN